MASSGHEAASERGAYGGEQALGLLFGRAPVGDQVSRDLGESRS
jgi:hypothetical protein